MPRSPKGERRASTSLTVPTAPTAQPALTPATKACHGRPCRPRERINVLDEIGARARLSQWLIGEKQLRWELPWLLRFLPQSRAPLWITVPLFVLAAFLMAWGMEPKRTEGFVGRLPFGNYLLKALAKLDLILPGRS